MFFYLELPNLPQPPAHFINRCYDIMKTATTDNDFMTGWISSKEFQTRKIIKNGKEMNTRSQRGFHIGDDWEHWVRENIVSDFYDAGLRISFGENTNIHGPHCDNPDKWKLYYLIDKGEDGDNAETVFYYDPGKPIEIRNMQVGINYCVNNIDRLVPIFKVKIPLHTWVLLNVNVLHGVENIEGNRINLAVLINKDQLEFTIKLTIIRNLKNWKLR